MEQKFDAAILGGGPAGLSSAIYCSRYGMKIVVISRDVGGMASLAHKIENYPGYEGSGFELMNKFYKQAKNFGAEIINDDLVGIKKNKGVFEVATLSGKKIEAKAVIIALGTQRKKLNVKGEDKFLGRGVSYCATCDGNFFKGKDVAIIGGGDTAGKAAELLSSLARKVYIIYRGEKLKCERILTKKLEKKENIEHLCNATALEIKGNDKVTGIIIEQDGRRRTLKLDGVFIEIGSMPVVDIASVLKINVDKEGYVAVNDSMETNVPGVFAAGDVIKSRLKQVVIAASQGAIAAHSAYEYLKSK